MKTVITLDTRIYQPHTILMALINLKKIFHYILFSFVLLSTFFYLPVPSGTPLKEAIDYGYQIQELLFRYGTFLMVLISCFLNTEKRKGFNVYFVLFSIYVLISNLFSFDIASRRQVLNVLTAFILFKTITENYCHSYFKTFCKFCLAIVIMNLVWCVLQYFGHDPIFSRPDVMGKMDQMVGFMKIKVNLGILATYCAPFLFFLNPWLVLLILPLIFFSFSSTCAVAYVLSLIYLFYSRYGKLKTFILSSLIAALAGFYILKFDMPTGQFSERFDVWERTLSYALRSNMFWGNGLGSFANWEPVTSQLTQTEKLSWIWAHNEYIQMIFEGGIAGLIFVILYIKNCFKNAFKYFYHENLTPVFASLFCVFISSFFHFPFHLARLVPFIILVMAIFEATKTDIENGDV